MVGFILDIDQNRAARIFRAETIHGRQDPVHIRPDLVDEDIIILIDLNQDRRRSRRIAVWRSIRRWPHVDPLFREEGRSHDKEDQQDKDDIQHRGHVDLGLVVRVLGPTSHD